MDSISVDITGITQITGCEKTVPEMDDSDWNDQIQKKGVSRYTSKDLADLTRLKAMYEVKVERIASTKTDDDDRLAVIEAKLTRIKEKYAVVCKAITRIEARGETIVEVTESAVEAPGVTK